MLHPISNSFQKQHTQKTTLTLFTVLLFIVMHFSFQANAQGDLLIFPKRIVFENNTRSQTVNLTNTGKDTARYNISFVQIRMKEDGSMENITTPDPGQSFADPYLRCFPRSVTLAPNESQTVKVQLIKTSELKQGEYRSHLYFRAEPTSKPLGENEKVKDSSTISIKLTPVFGISMAAIIRVGENDTKVNISEAALDSQNGATPVLNLIFNRTGPMSVYGDVFVDHVSKQGKVTRVGMVKGLAVYTPNKIRRFNLVLDKKAGVDYRSGKLKVVYTDQSPKTVVLAEKEI
jgi:hypothetical protein